jgi:hypothetical protein
MMHCSPENWHGTLNIWAQSVHRRYSDHKLDLLARKIACFVVFLETWLGRCEFVFDCSFRTKSRWDNWTLTDN